jgi:hypothetical protein
VTHEQTTANEPPFQEGPRISLGVPLLPMSLAITIPCSHWPVACR